jgi:non-canonical poly(A) RNA polymerase PAPD5/7
MTARKKKKPAKVLKMVFTRSLVRQLDALMAIQYQSGPTLRRTLLFLHPNEAAEKADANNAVAANDDFISFGDDDGSAQTTDLQVLDDDEPKTNKRPQDGGFVQGSMNDLDYVDSTVDGGSQNKRSYQTADLHDQPQQSKAKRKRGETEGVRGIVQEWLATARCDTAPWLDPRHSYAHLVNDPLKW